MLIPLFSGERFPSPPTKNPKPAADHPNYAVLFEAWKIQQKKYIFCTLCVLYSTYEHLPTTLCVHSVQLCIYDWHIMCKLWVNHTICTHNQVWRFSLHKLEVRVLSRRSNHRWSPCACIGSSYNRLVTLPPGSIRYIAGSTASEECRLGPLVTIGIAIRFRWCRTWTPPGGFYGNHLCSFWTHGHDMWLRCWWGRWVRTTWTVQGYEGQADPSAMFGGEGPSWEWIVTFPARGGTHGWFLVPMEQCAELLVLHHWAICGLDEGVCQKPQFGSGEHGIHKIGTSYVYNVHIMCT